MNKNKTSINTENNINEKMLRALNNSTQPQRLSLCSTSISVIPGKHARGARWTLF